MKLPEAIALMLEGKVMAEEGGDFIRIAHGEGFLAEHYVIEWFDPEEEGWYDAKPYFHLDGWREATPEEFKEIGL